RRHGGSERGCCTGPQTGCAYTVRSGSSQHSRPPSCSLDSTERSSARVCSSLPPMDPAASSRALLTAADYLRRPCLAHHGPRGGTSAWEIDCGKTARDTCCV